jgi:hypothetical protein
MVNPSLEKLSIVQLFIPLPSSNSRNDDSSVKRSCPHLIFSNVPGAHATQHAMSQKLNSAIAVIGIDFGNNSFHVVGQDQRWRLAAEGPRRRAAVGALRRLTFVVLRRRVFIAMPPVAAPA